MTQTSSMFRRIGFTLSAIRPLIALALLLFAHHGVAQTNNNAKSSDNKAPVTSTTPLPATEVQEQSPPPATPAPAPPPDALGRSTPYGTVLGFLRAAEAQDYPRAAKYLDSKLPTPETEHLAIQLKALIDLGAATNLENISHETQGNTDDDLRISREKVGTISTPAGAFDILLDRIERSGESNLWLFSQETLARVPAAYASTQHKDISRYFPEWTSRLRILSVPLWRWAVIVIAVAIGFFLARVLSHFLLRLLRILFRHRMTPGVESAIRRLNGPVFGIILALTQRIAADYTITALGRHYWILAATITADLSIVWLLIRLTDICTAFAVHRLYLQQQIERITAVGLVARLLKILFVITLGIVLLTVAGVNVSAVFAGLGIGGIALALAAQKTLSDLFGGISIVMRGAVRVNDYCTVAGQTGSVEEIGISALRLRTLDRSVISIPNSKVAEMELENFTMRDQFWVHQTFTLRFDTSASTMQKVLEDIRLILKHRPEIDESSARVRIIQLTPSGPQIEVYAYYNRPGGDYNAFLAEQEKVILEIMRIVEEAGTSLTNPVGIVRLDKDPVRSHPVVN